ncbi:MAG: sigma 54-interacting transcriptional regulator, partial [Myxococcales bacterium]|nr:sigma 54-interacting transcriptional regulator [Myxococcales bacterium]
FGHRKGAFTGAIADKRGLFELADGGTLFLDEVGDMSPTMQVKLLRVLQEGTFLPVGDTVERKVDVRVIAATNRNLRKMVSEGTFREDLYYRLNVIYLEVPSLRARIDDLAVLVDHFLTEYSTRTGQARKKLSPEALKVMTQYRWPGNIRELRHEIERLVVLSGDDAEIPHTALSRRILESVDLGAAIAADPSSSLPDAVEALERRMIREALDETGWNKTQAAKRLGVSRRNLIRKVQSYDME